MAADVQTGMDKQDMKRLLMKSKKEPVNCAIGLGSDPGFGLLMMDKVKAPKGVEKELIKQIPDAKNTRFGTVFVDLEVDAKLVQFDLNKPISSIARKLVKTLKGTGFTKVRIVVDGQAVEDAAEEEEGAPLMPGQPPAADAQASAPPMGATAPPAAPPAAAAATAAEPTAAAPPAAPPAATQSATPPPPAQAAAPPAADLAALTRALTDLVKRLAKAEPLQQTRMKGLAALAQDRLKANDAVGAKNAIDEFRATLDEAEKAAAASAAAAAAAAPQGAPAAAPQGTPAPAARAPAAAKPPPAAYVKARTAWLATRQKLETDISKLQTTFASAFKDHDMAADLQAAFQTRVEKVLGQFDVQLADKLDEVTKATDAGQHTKLVGEARQIIKRYEAYIASDSTLTEIDNNPFVPMQLQKSLTTTLSVLDSSLG